MRTKEEATTSTAGDAYHEWVSFQRAEIDWLPVVSVAMDDEPTPHSLSTVGTTYAVQTPTPPPVENTREKGPDFYLNAGDAIRTLRRELPALFQQDLTYDIYREDIVFRDPRNTFAGLERYKSIFKTVRVFGRIFFRPQKIEVEILRIWQPSEHKIVIRWQIHGEPWQMPGFYKESRLDGTSEFKLDSNGKIYEHKVDTKTMAPGNYMNVLSSMLNLSVARQQNATPSFFTTYDEFDTLAEHPTSCSPARSQHATSGGSQDEGNGKTWPVLAVLAAVWHVAHGSTRRVDAPPGGSGA